MYCIPTQRSPGVAFPTSRRTFANPPSPSAACRTSKRSGVCPKEPGWTHPSIPGVIHVYASHRLQAPVRVEGAEEARNQTKFTQTQLLHRFAIGEVPQPRTLRESEATFGHFHQVRTDATAQTFSEEVQDGLRISRRKPDVHFLGPGQLLSLQKSRADVLVVDHPALLNRHQVQEVVPQGACRRKCRIIKSRIRISMPSQNPTSFEFCRTKLGLSFVGEDESGVEDSGGIHEGVLGHSFDGVMIYVDSHRLLQRFHEGFLPFWAEVGPRVLRPSPSVPVITSVAPSISARCSRTLTACKVSPSLWGEGAVHNWGLKLLLQGYEDRIPPPARVCDCPLSSVSLKRAHHRGVVGVLVSGRVSPPSVPDPSQAPWPPSSCSWLPKSLGFASGSSATWLVPPRSSSSTSVRACLMKSANPFQEAGSSYT